MPDWGWWVAWIIVGVAIEARALRDESDDHHPLTDYILAVMAYSLLSRMWIAGLLVWLFLHLFAGVM